MPVELETLRRDLQQQVRQLTEDLRERSDTVDAVRDRLQGEYSQARDSGRTAATYNEWREGMLTQGAVAWVLGGVFVRFLEDNGLLPEPFITGPGDRARQARERRDGYFREHPTDSDRDYFLDVFRTVGTLPALKELFDKRHNPLWQLTPSGDAARDLWEFWRRVVPETGELVHDFTDPEWETRFLGDLYEQLSEHARKQFALLQTPEFVEEFILDRTLEPAIEDFDLEEVRLIDPTCGSGHFLIGAFHRLLGRWQRKAPGMPIREQVSKVLAAVAGVDINPFAVNIARFRLLVAALKAEGVRRVKEAPGYHFELAAGDSLLHGLPLDELGMDHSASMRQDPTFGHAYEAEDSEALTRLLGRHYHAVVGNPPYITVKDKAQNALYRRFYQSCSRQYALTVPFAERFFLLAMPGGGRLPSGYVGMIIADNFMRREFGKKLVESFLPKVNVTHLIHTAGAYIPGHGVTTIILLGKSEKPSSDKVRALVSLKGEPGTPVDSSQGKVWKAIVDQVDCVGSQSEYISVEDIDRGILSVHPWSLSSGAAQDVKILIEENRVSLGARVTSVGFYQDTHADEIFVLPNDFIDRYGLGDWFRFQVRGEFVRHWCLSFFESIFFPFDEELNIVSCLPARVERVWLFLFRTFLGARKTFSGATYKEGGVSWFDYHQFPRGRAKDRRSIAFSEIATHNHFVLDEEGFVFNRSAPVIKLGSSFSYLDCVSFLAVLNSSVACFWLKQVCHNKGSTVDSKGARQTTDSFENFYQFNSSNVKRFPLLNDFSIFWGSEIDELAKKRRNIYPYYLKACLPASRADLEEIRDKDRRVLMRMIGLQEEIDWECYHLYGIAPYSLHYSDSNGDPRTPPPVRCGERAFEIAMARSMGAGELETTWFDRHGSQPVTEVPEHWPEDYRRLVEERIQCIEGNRYINLLEQPEYKRRWNVDNWEDLERDALREWLLDRLEEGRYWNTHTLQTTNSLAGLAETDQDFVAVAELYLGQSGVNVQRLVAELIEGESVPLLPVLRYKKDGLRKRADWERTWELQRQEDAVDAKVAASMARRENESDEDFQQRLKGEQDKEKRRRVGDIPVPPKYKTADFLNTTFWRLRGSLDVPKERFFSLPHCSPDGDDGLLIGWAGWDSLQRLQAVAGCYTDRRQEAGWPATRLTPLLAAMDELLPWVKQWHNEPDPEFGRMGDFFETYLASQLQELGLTRADLTAWTPPVTRRRK
ncbi:MULTISPECIES: BREX-2 system adenine-specific DNA-methyltransferase PglX [unclassified Halorhodospira]|uniref:BREX-2 system adenine-specific DNA-methyltransferase PglX n=1 Tax=unclassified Halorhodospira TaxID=2626748 RepID=UPI001EE87B81|nr:MULTISPECIES: BREX-2 system adenine-specific DNA-methyltransferase PglX [unclassified Halorhodospira]MCG5541816.1 BREX-2 system adenine-specific DNA-methyltransferase PglX [Halorhodospira sp. M39old]MCG5546901.1 BREX-2 system adenine-specific DNA-methyltransferase PglX [Halorhodospira sp. M38]